MKKSLIFILVFALCFSLIGCSGDGKPSSSETSSTPTSSAGGENAFCDDSGKITLGTAELSVGMEITEAIINKVGEPDDILSAPSCFFDGEDAIYIYEDFSLYTYLDGDKNYLYIIELSTSANETELGAAVGMNIYDVEELYGEAASSTATSKVYKTGENSKIRFTFDDTDTVTLIEYELVG